MAGMGSALLSFEDGKEVYRESAARLPDSTPFPLVREEDEEQDMHGINSL